MTKRFIEENDSFVESIAYDEAKETATITVLGIVADHKNINGRVYPRKVLQSAVKDLAESMNNTSAKSARKLITAELEHPGDKAMASLKETVALWTSVTWDEERGGPRLVGETVPTTQGKEFAKLARFLYERGYPIPVSQRARGKASYGIWNGEQAEILEALSINGYDFCLTGSDQNALVLKLESEESNMEENQEEVLDVTPEPVVEEPVAESVVEPDVEPEPEPEPEPVVEPVEEPVIDESAAIIAEKEKALQEALAKLAEREKALEESEAIRKASEAKAWIIAHEIPENYPEEVATKLRAIEPKDMEEAQLLWDAKLSEYKEIVQTINSAKAAMNEAQAFAEGKEKAMETLNDRGMNQGAGVTNMTEGWEQKIAPLDLTFNESVAPAVKEIANIWDKIETSANKPLAFQPSNPRKNASHNLGKVMLESYLFNHEEAVVRGLAELEGLRAKRAAARAAGRSFDEAPTLKSAWNLPYLVMAGVLPEVYASLVSPQVFMVKPIEHETERYYVEAWGTTPTAAIDDEVVVGQHDEWVQMAHPYIRRGSFVLTDTTEVTTYVNGTDYVVDYEEGKLWVFSAGAITDAQSLKADYTYALIAQGENQPIELVTTSTNYITLQVSAKRLGFNLTDEAIRFATSDLSYDAQGSHLSNAVYRLAQELDTKMFEAAETYALMSGMKTSVWYQTPQGADTIDENLRLLVDRISDAAGLLDQYYNEPTHVVMTNNIARKFHRTDLLDTDTQRRGVNIDSEFYLGQIYNLPVYRIPYGQYHNGYVLVLSGRDTVVKGIYSPLEIVGGPEGFINRATTGDVNRLVAARGWYVQEYNDVRVPVDPTDSNKTRRIAVVPVGA